MLVYITLSFLASLVALCDGAPVHCRRLFAQQNPVFTAHKAKTFKTVSTMGGSMGIRTDTNLARAQIDSMPVFLEILMVL
jgi:hypothetical protein